MRTFESRNGEYFSADLDQAITALQNAKAFLQTVRQEHDADVQRLEA